MHNEYNWKKFCTHYVGELLVNEWTLLEEKLGLNFIEMLEGEDSEYLHSPLVWSDLEKLMGESGLRGPDAMIINLFAKSKFNLLISSGKDFTHYFSGSSRQPNQNLLLLG